MQYHQVDYALTFEDVLAFCRYDANHLPDGRKRRQTRYGVWLFLAFLLLLPAAVSFKEPPLAVLVLALPSIVIASVFRHVYENHVRDFLLRRSLRKADRTWWSWWLRPHHLRISPESLTDTSDLLTCIWRWDAIHCIVRTEDHLFFVTPSQAAYVIPRSAFKGDTEFQAFVDAMRTFSSRLETGIMEKSER